MFSVVKGRICEIQNWRELRRYFCVFVTKDMDTVHDFFCDRLEPHDPLDLQWIFATNTLVNQINHHL
jgi:hypothetical protein